MAYTKTSWVNGSGPDLDQTNLNKMETGIAEAHDRFTLRGLDADKPAASALTANRLYVVTGGGIYVDTGTALEFVAARTWDQLTGKPTSFSPAAHGHLAGDLPMSTQTEANTGTAADKIVSPATLKGTLDNRRPLNAYARASRGTVLSIPNAAFTAVVFTVSDEDGRSWRTSGSVYTVDAAGLYALTFDASWATNNTGVRINRFVINGASYAGSQRSGAQQTSEVSNTTQVKLAAGDTVGVEVYQNSTAALDLTAGARLVIARVI